MGGKKGGIWLGEVGFTFLSLFNFGKFATEVKPTLIVLRNSSSSNSSVRPSIFPSYDLQLSRTSSFTCKRGEKEGKYKEFQGISNNQEVLSREMQEFEKKAKIEAKISVADPIH